MRTGSPFTHYRPKVPERIVLGCKKKEGVMQSAMEAGRPEGYDLKEKESHFPPQDGAFE